MRAFWNPVIKPLLDTGAVHSIVEVGAERGALTRQLADYSRKHDGVTHSIDPAPRFDVAGFEERYGGAFRFYEARSLEVLPKLRDLDLALIDGDHNYYTVLGELRALGESRPFPITLLHDIGWPYGRRDLYYDPDSIPADARHRHRRDGVLPGQDALSEDGFNAHLIHAEFEGGPRNGVLTAVERFVEESGEPLRLVKLVGLHGLGILASQDRLDGSEKLKKLIGQFASKAMLVSFAQQVEAERCERARSRQRDALKIERATAEAAELSKRLESSNRASKKERARLRGLLEVRAHELEVLAYQLLDSEAAAADASATGARAREELAEATSRLSILEEEFAEGRETHAADLAALEEALSRVEEGEARLELESRRRAELELRAEQLQRSAGGWAAKARDARRALAEEADARRVAIEAARDLESRLSEKAERERLLAMELARAQSQGDAQREALRAARRELDRRRREAEDQRRAAGAQLDTVEELREAVAAQRGRTLAQYEANRVLFDRFEAEREEIAAGALRLAESRSWRFGHGLALAVKRLRPGKRRRESALDRMIERLGRPLPSTVLPEADEPARGVSDPAEPQSGPPASQLAEQVASLTGVSGETPIDLDVVDRLRDAPPVSIVVPVFNATTEVRRCLDSLARNTTATAAAVIVDDASTDPSTVELLDSYAELTSFRLVRNESNLGFTESVNRGIQAVPDGDDVILLNSDTEVGPRWLENMRIAAYSAKDVGTVTPLSDNAGAFSAPVLAERNPTPPGLGTDAVARLVTQSAGRIYPETPTGSGFCLYVKREMLDAVGAFDSENFPRGYGEENDFCMRGGALGWRHLVDDKTYVRHEREASFGAEKESLMKSGREAVDRLHPTYTEEVRAFVRSPAIEAARASVRFGFAHHGEVPARPRILFVLHEGQGGTPQTNADLMRALRADYDCFLLTSDTKTIRLTHCDGVEYQVDSWKLERQWKVTDFSREDFRRVALEVLANHAIEIVHVRHLFKHTLDLPKVAKALGIPVVVSFHDFYLACPSVHLLDESDRYCEGVCTPGDGTCRQPSALLADMPHLKHSWIHTWREEVGEILAGADALVTTSDHARDVYERAYPALDAPFEVIEHGRDFPTRGSAARRPKRGKPIRIAIPGSFEFHKGSAYIEQLKELDVDGELELHFLGKNGPPDRSGLGTDHGGYTREEYLSRMEEIGPALVGIFSIWPETYCHVLTEAWAAGIPVLATDIGALGERIRRHGGGWLVPRDDPAAALDRIREIAGDSESFEAVRTAVAAIPLRDTASMAREYDVVYRRAVQGRRPMVSRSDRGTAAPLDTRIIKVAACVPGAEGREPGSSYVRVLTRLNHPTIASRVQSYRPGADRLLDTGDRPDVVLVQRTAIPPKVAELLLPQVKARSIPLILELDDDLLALRDDPLYSDHVETVQSLIGEADLVTVSTRWLASSIDGSAERVEVLPNALDECLWFDGREEDSIDGGNGRESGPIRVLYMGTRTHAADLAMLRPAFELISDQAGVDIRLEVIGGESGGGDQDWYERLAVPHDHSVYPRFVRWMRGQRRRWHLAVAPLVDNEFNRSKSDLKFLEYTGLGLPTILSDVEAYREVREGAEAVKTGPGAEAWAEAVLRLAGDESERGAAGRGGDGSGALEPVPGAAGRKVSGAALRHHRHQRKRHSEGLGRR